MNPNFTMTEKNGEVHVVAGDATRPYGRSLVSFLATAALCIVFGYRYFALKTLVPSALAIGALFAIFVLRKRISELHVTRQEMRTSGFLKNGPIASIPLADIQRLEYRPFVSGGEEFRGQHEGVYVETRYGARCMLTFVNETETNRVIDAIYRNFPEILKDPPENRSLLFADDAIRLNLNQ